MKILIAPNAFKECLTATQVAIFLEKGIKKVAPSAECILLPLSDGGDGFLNIIEEHFAGERYTYLVSGPRNESLRASFFYQPLEKTAFLEMAQSSGLARIPLAKRNPLLTSSFGTGELLAKILPFSPKRIILGIGGSATCDGGMGIIQALGVRFLDKSGDLLEPIAANLSKIHEIDVSALSPAWKEITFEVFCDVQNPLLGPFGAAPTYAPQKGASPEQVEILERGLTHLAHLMEKQFGASFHNLPHGGSAGGAGAGLCAFLGATLLPGATSLLYLLEAEKYFEKVDLVVTAEGCLDAQTAYGKVPAEVGRLAQKYQKPCFAFAGQITSEAEKLREFGISALFSICSRPLTLAEAFSEVDTLLSRAAEEAIRAFLCGQKKLF